MTLTVTIASCSQGPATNSGIPDSLWNDAVTDTLKPIGFLPDEPNPPPVHLISAYREGDIVGAWRLLEIRNDGMEIVIQYSQGGICDTDKGVIVAETSTEVAIVPVYRNPTMPCNSTAVLLTPSGVVTLDKPLGDRKLLHIPGDNTLPTP